MDTIDLYCERTGPEFWAEPLNAVTNIAFILAAFCVWRMAGKDARGLVLAAMIAVIGGGSFLFHTLARPWAMLADSIPILVFQIAFIYFYARHVIALSKKDSAALLGLFAVSIYVFGQVPKEVWNGSVSYAPALLFLGGLALWHRKNAPREKNTLLAAAAVFGVSLIFRSLDMALCAIWPIGVHFLWHILNGAVLCLSARAYIVNAKNL